MAKCLYCGKEIRKRVYWQKFCSSKCRLYYYVLKNNIEKIKRTIRKYVKDKNIVEKIIQEIWKER